MEKIIFLDIDGVLNSYKTFKDNYQERRFYNKILELNDENLVRIMLLNIDFYKLELLKEIVYQTGSKIVVTSCWCNLRLYPLIEEYLIQKGLPIIDKTLYIDNKRGKEIIEYLNTHNVDKFVILDDDIFKDFEWLENFLVKTDFYLNGLESSHVEEAINILGLKR